MPRADRVPFLAGQHLIAVHAVLNESFEAILLADTGAQHSVISQSGARRLSLQQTIRMQALVGVGRSPPVPVVRLDRLRVGASTVRGLEVFVYDLPPLLGANGLLGLDFL
jgi:predicted aspartyl protease